MASAEAAFLEKFYDEKFTLDVVHGEIRAGFEDESYCSWKYLKPQLERRQRESDPLADVLKVARKYVDV